MENLILITWATMPPLLMYVYSYLSQPIFGPPRYHLFIAPAYLILLAHGLSQLPTAIRWPLVAAALVLSLLLLQKYQPVLKADWRGMAAWLKRAESHGGAASSPPLHVTIVVHPSDPRFRREEVEAARYYLSSQALVMRAGEPSAAMNPDPSGPVYDVLLPFQAREN